MNDFEYQLGFVIDASWRMAGMQDRNPLSPSYGCFHYGYWRDKTSEFADARFQEAGAAFGLLSLPQFDDARRDGRLASRAALYDAFSAALGAWANSQHAEGCWDEWYKGERGFAATEFTMIAYGLAARYLGDGLRADDRQRLLATMGKAADWLAPRHDRVKANHEAAAAAALALAWEVTGEERHKTAAAEKIADTLARQTDEGWFPEIGGMDLGYCSVLLDYVMVYVLATGDAGPVPAMRRLLAFMFPHIHPDCTISPEAGLCLNPYVSRLGIGLLSEHDDANAAAVMATLENSSPGQAGLAPTLADDLRLCRWSYLPIVTMLERTRFKKSDGGAEALADLFPGGWTVRKESAVAACHDGTTHVYFSVAGGGAVRVFWGRELVWEDIGIDVVSPGELLGSAGYSLDRPMAQVPGGVEFKDALGKAVFFYPGFLSRLLLRLGSVTPFSSRLLRRLIDTYRLRKGTAINQSAAPLAGTGGGILFERRVVVEDGAVTITDRLERADGGIDSRFLRPNLTVRGETPPVIEGMFRSASVVITKSLREKEGRLAFSVSIDHE